MTLSGLEDRTEEISDGKVINRAAVEQAFIDYVSDYNLNDTKIKLKKDHTFRVAGLCDEIAGSLQFIGEDRDLAWLCGMLHDIGRFEQIRRYGTFKDAESINHAHFGVQLLFEDYLFDLFRPVIPENKMTETVNILQKSIYNHSEYRLPENLTNREEMFCNILRDADKIDILKVNVEIPMEEIYNTTRAELMNAEVSGAVMEAFHECRAIPHRIKGTVVDHLVGHISLVYELVYDMSLTIVKEQGYLTKMLQFKSENPVCRKQFLNIKEIMEAYLERTNCIS